MRQAVVVGSGPNGLAAAVTLAEAGLAVRVVEAGDRIGGGVDSEELTLPGLVHDTCSAFHPFGPVSPFMSRFGLEGEGLRWRWAPYELAHPLPDGRGAVLHRSVADTAAGLGGDGAVWAGLLGPLAEHFDALSAEILQPVAHMPTHPLVLARYGAPAATPAAMLARVWRGEAARALFAGAAAHALRPLGAPFSSAIALALLAAAHGCGWPVAQGGSGAIRDAVLRRARRAGVEIETGRRIRSRREVEPGSLIMLDTSPAAAAQILADALPGHVARAYRAYRHGPGVAKVDMAVAEGVPWRHLPSRQAGTVHLGGTLAQVAAAEREVWRGRMPRHPFILVGQQYLADPGRAHGGVYPLYAYAHVPAGWPGDVTRLVTDEIERYAPGFRERVLASTSRSALDLQAANANYVGGDIIAGASTARQLVARPRLAANPYATGVPGAYLCSAATPPGAGAHGMCGYLAARAALKDLGERR
ncbi:NAD(P)/FAD-dependent oxidoreductase [Actinomyces sp. 2119]|uniref:phytoene desaturase family protein n=1 Tax=Actinomyces sp. 2119 TaxID=2321393 RepID=UPI000E6C769E|nr:NAD(P)/FAD-dependent oxidoreductase [Actinomyces sp. 2119]RJF42456.1 NAD(P)/FAD-dependent oxidoreductase [Actinomyces sp. 2119]